MILEQIQNPEDIKKLDLEEQKLLAQEIRDFLIEKISVTGGHLASNLGVVELTIAMFLSFDLPEDKIIWDVGHQAYTHKILTGRREQMSTIRQLGGIAGFPKPSESVHDAFIAGHASNSVAVALGMAQARDVMGEDNTVAALIGDGALTGGLAYEGLSTAGQSRGQLLVILNDNGMSINPNVGAVDSHLSQIRSKPAYYHFKKWYRGLFGQHPMENPLYRFNHKVKTSLKKALWPGSTLFEDMGFTYLGPIDGHDLDRLVHVLAWARELQCPVVVHVKTVKGRGYSFAEQNPDKFHGVGPFDPETGLVKKSGGDDFSAVFGRTLAACAAEDGRVCAITAAMADGTGLAPFAKEFPDRFFDVAIAEGHGVAMAAGLAGEMLHAQILAFSGPVLAAPAMNPRMWMNPATQANCTALASRGVTLVTPDSGSMACGDTGQGRLAPVSVLFLYALQALAPQDMIGQKVLVTLGPTREPWDGVRFWSNPSSGTMGACLAFAAWMRGAEVTAVTGSSVSRDLLPSGIPYLSRVDCGTASEMYDAAAAAWPDCSMGFFSAAVADFSPVPYGSHKFKKADAQNGFSVEFAPNRDILATLAAARRPGQKVLGFAAETASSMEELLGLARKKRQRKGCDVIAANIVGRKGSGFASETNSMAVAGPGEAGEIWETRSKADVAWDLCSCLLNA